MERWPLSSQAPLMFTPVALTSIPGDLHQCCELCLLLIVFVPAEHLGNRSWEPSSQAKNAKSGEASPDPTCASVGTYGIQRVWWGFWKEPVPVVGVIWQASPTCLLCVWTWGSHTPCPGFCHLQEGTTAPTQPEDINYSASSGWVAVSQGPAPTSCPCLHVCRSVDQG